MLKVLITKLKESFISVFPVAAIVIILNFTPLINFSTIELIVFSICTALLILGIGLFNLGADTAMTPMGEHIGAGLSKSRNMLILLSVCFAMGVLITVAEPDLTVLAAQVKDMISSTLLILTVGVGVGIFLVIAVIKIITRRSLSSMLIFFYLVLFALVALLAINEKKDFLALGFDSGGVTTGPITVPFIMTLGVGIATTLGGKDVGENSFGLIAMCSIGPILAVILLGLISSGSINYQVPEYSVEAHLGIGLLSTVLGKIKEVAIALGLIVAFFTVLQVIYLKLPRKKLIQIAVGIGFTFLGLVIFLAAVEIGFMPIGYKIGVQLS